MTTYGNAPGPGALPGQRMTREQLIHFYVGIIPRAPEQNRLRPIVVPLFDGPQLRQNDAAPSPGVLALLGSESCGEESVCAGPTSHPTAV
jgi:hypothetical protein